MAMYYVRRAFRVVDCTRYMGLPTRTACIVLTLIVTALNLFALYFLPAVVYVILMIYAGIIGLLGLIASVTSITFITTLCIIGQALMIIPLLILMGYTGFVANDFNCDFFSHYNYHIIMNKDYPIDPCPSYYTQYECDLCLNFSDGWLWGCFAGACLAIIFGAITNTGYNKLRLLQSGNHTVSRPTNGYRIETVATQPIVYHQPTTTVYTTTAAYPTMVTPNPIITQQVPPPYEPRQTNIYPPVPDQSLYNQPPQNPTYQNQ